MLLNVFFRNSFPVLLRSPINAGAFCMLAGLVLVPVVSALTPQLEKSLVDGIFACYDKKVITTARDSIGNEEAV
jgi:SSS family solute:Na+ symporter